MRSLKVSTFKFKIWSAAVLLATAAALLMPSLAPEASATTIWKEIASGTTHDITGIEYQAADRFWYVTATGEIFKRQPDGTFSLRLSTSVPLNDIEFQTGGNIGFAVGNGGQVYRSTDAGDSWSNVNPGSSPIPVSRDDSTAFADCRGSDPLGDVNSVRFAGAARVWIFAEGSQLARSQAADLGAAGTWEDANRDTKGTMSSTDDTCRIPQADGIDDGFFVPANPDVGYICTAFLAKVYLTTNNLASDASEQPANCGNGSIPDRHMTGDPLNPSRMWVVGPGSGRSYTRYTEDGWATSFPFNLGSAGTFTKPFDVDYAEGTVLVAGDGGMILNSTNGRKFFFVKAGGTLANTNWRAVSLANASEGAVGGAGGKLVISPAASKTDVVPPQTTITSGPKAKSHDKTPTFKFRSSESGSTFKCRMDRGFYKKCTSPKTYGTLRFGDHVFRVKAKDKAGNWDPTPAKWKFKITRRS